MGFFGLKIKLLLSLCRLIYPGFEMTQFFVHLILRIIENPLTRAFADDCQLHQLRRPGDVVWDAVRDGDGFPHRMQPLHGEL